MSKYKPIPASNMICPKCESSFQTTNNKQKFCSPQCRQSYTNSLTREKSRCATFNFSTGTAGAIAEIIAVIKLAKLGFDVFRAISPSCSCDLVALKNNKCLRVEVKSGYADKSNNLRWSCPDESKKKCDWFAIVRHDDEVFFVQSTVANGCIKFSDLTNSQSFD